MIMKILGAGLTVLGTAGLGIGMCREQRERMGLLGEFERFLELAAGEISYGACSLPVLFSELAETVPGPTGQLLAAVGIRLQSENGESLTQIWNEEMEVYLLGTPLHMEEKQLICSFPEELEFLDRQRQMQALERLGERIGRIRQQLAEKQETFEKTTMALCLAGGAVSVILFL